MFPIKVAGMLLIDYQLVPWIWPWVWASRSFVKLFFRTEKKHFVFLYFLHLHLSTFWAQCKAIMDYFLSKNLIPICLKIKLAHNGVMSPARSLRFCMAILDYLRKKNTFRPFQFFNLTDIFATKWVQSVDIPTFHDQSKSQIWEKWQKSQDRKVFLIHSRI